MKLGAEQINKMLAAGEISGVVLDPHRGTEESIDAILAKVPDVRIISIWNVRDFSPELTQVATKLEELSMPEKSLLFSLELLPKLTRLGVKWSGRAFLGAESSKLEDLSIWSYRSRKEGLTDIPSLSHLKRLRLVQGGMKTLHGISRYAELVSLELHMCARLELINGMQLRELKYFTADSCRRILDHEMLSSSPNLEFIGMHNCGEIKSLRFLADLKKLRSFRFLQTVVLDNDLSPLAQLEDVFFTEKKCYSHRVTDFRQGDEALARMIWYKP